MWFKNKVSIWMFPVRLSTLNNDIFSTKSSCTCTTCRWCGTRTRSCCTRTTAGRWTPAGTSTTWRSGMCASLILVITGKLRFPPDFLDFSWLFFFSAASRKIRWDVPKSTSKCPVDLGRLSSTRRCTAATGRSTTWPGALSPFPRSRRFGCSTGSWWWVQLLSSVNVSQIRQIISPKIPVHPFLPLKSTICKRNQCPSARNKPTRVQSSREQFA